MVQFFWPTLYMYMTCTYVCFPGLCAQGVECPVDIFHYTLLWIRLRRFIGERLTTERPLAQTSMTPQVSAVSQKQIISVELHRFLMLPIDWRQK